MKLKFWNPIVRRKTFTRPKPSLAKNAFTLRDGPLHASKVYMCTAGTLAFRIGDHRGYYNQENKWCEL